MATLERGERPALSGFVATARVLLILVFTGVETAVLVVWLGFVEGAPVASRATAIGLGVLAAGLVVEHVLTDLTVNGPDLTSPNLGVVGLSASETVLWGLWLVIAERVGGFEGFALAAAFLAVTLVPQHTLEDNLLRGRDPFSSLLDPGTIGFSVVESVGGTIWLALVLRPDLVAGRLGSVGLDGVDPALVGVVVLAVSLFVEHSIGVMYTRR